ncbi:nucleoside-diphosphate-sugar epimerase [Terriglobus roseus DSM 18391]|uniref:Nucleoside-diphosphate-sugar epimerase n=1 Tax=Terriglobus roseus (strain DSM 18391 / NRRL B-41598 / KBS 63) TaxID=926566 RepID=I3ZG06_TERRK|nr:NAD-dependent epimerase/dehydratase family protein [Terriglobus roseus]AFL88174.1 nucleoside-diphosphate-sugar epimerase [Terriglobus roseus DSM 18391]
MAYLVTGGCGFVGSNLTAELLRRGEQVVVLDNFTRPGTPINYAWLQTIGRFDFFHGDVRNSQDVETIFRAFPIDCVFHLAGQVAMTTSLENPRRDFEVNVLGSINVLEAVRLHAPDATVVYASSNKVYGELEACVLEEKPTRYEPAGKKDVDERARLEFYTPYGCSKGAADQYMQEYARNFKVKSVVFRHSTIYGGRQISTFDQGWVGWFCQQAIETKHNPSHSFTINGDGKQVRDLLHVSDAVACYLAAHENRAQGIGNAFNIGGGYENSMSLRELFLHLEKELGIKMNPRELPWRANDQKYFVADNSKALRLIGWSPKKAKADGIADSLAWELQRRNA